MPAAVLKSLASKSGVGVDRAERLWDKAKDLAAKDGRKDDYGYIVGIVKKMLGLKKKESYVCEILEAIDSLAAIKKIEITYVDDKGGIKYKRLFSMENQE